MFNWIKAIGRFFSALFGGSGDVVKVILHDIAYAVNLSAPIVAALSTLAQSSPDKSGLIGSIERWLGIYHDDANKIASWVEQAQGLPYLDVIRSAATMALSALVPAGTAASLLNLAIELAYNIFKKQQTVGA